jgi:rSAM/selenodomain-associated transferase 1
LQPGAVADLLAVFVKAPEPGRVKTRLAHEIGAEEAAALYRRLGRAVVSQCTANDRHRTVVWFAPVEGGAAVRSWLNDLGVADFIAQRSGGLGQRLAGTFGRHFRAGARRVVVIGSDCPDVDRSVVQGAFAALEHSDLVLGPSEDGGFYLIGLAAPAPGLFRRVAWSTPAVFDQTARNAQRLGLSVSTLPVLRDIDTVADAQVLGWLATSTVDR